MHILILPSWYPTNKEDIRGCFFRDQALSLIKIGCQVGVVTNEFRSLKKWETIFSLKHGFFFENDNEINTIRFKTMYWFPRVPKLINIMSTFFGKKAIEMYIEKYGKPDIVHVHACLYMGELARYIKEKYDIQYVVTEHSSGYMRGLYTNYQLNIAKKTLEESSNNIAVSNSMVNFFSREFGIEDNWNIIPNIVNPIFFEKTINNVKNEGSNFKFINVAFMNRNKKQINIIKAFHELKKQGINNIELDLIGDGSEKAELEKYVDENKLNSINFLGTKDRFSIAELMSQSDCFILSSDFETFGVVVVEALAVGLPVISTRCGGPEDILNESNGLLVGKDNVMELAEAMKHILCINYDKYQIRSDCYNNYSEEAVTNKLISVYQKFII